MTVAASQFGVLGTADAKDDVYTCIIGIDRRTTARRRSRHRRGRRRQRYGDRTAVVSVDRQPAPIVDRQFEIEFLGRGVEAFAFTFG
jgi:hypothetical protein